MTWQSELAEEIAGRLPATAGLEVTGSAARPSTLDGWSDLDLQLWLSTALGLDRLLGGVAVWAWEERAEESRQVVRLVLGDGRRLDLVVTGPRRLLLPQPPVDNDVRFLAALAAAKLGRGDHLIGLHLVLEIQRQSLVQAMLLRDRDEGTTVHRSGSHRDLLAAEVAALARLPLEPEARPTLVEQSVGLYGTYRQQLEPDYRPDWSGLSALLARGLALDPGRGGLGR